jgi:hypothetical protein
MDDAYCRLRIERADETVRRTIIALMQARSISCDELADDAGIPLSTLKRRLRSTGSSYAFTAGEVRSLAGHFGFESGNLFRYLDGRYQPDALWRPERPSRPDESAVG